MKKNGPEKIDQLQKQRKNSSDGQSVKGVKSTTNRFLVTVNVLGSAGPLRFVVNENDLVAAVIDTALKSYAREGRLPVLGSDVNDFVLYCSDAGFDALNPKESIGSHGGRNFVLCKKQRQPQMTDGRSEMIAQKRGGSWKAWLNKPFSKIILSR